ncbi:hypothetical protein M0804_005248 [Polistes exclamans]|nr:hypothetical protein M0804_005248 [Polistes exclamans]
MSNSNSKSKQQQHQTKLNARRAQSIPILTKLTNSNGVKRASTIDTCSLWLGTLHWLTKASTTTTTITGAGAAAAAIAIGYCIGITIDTYTFMFTSECRE